MKEQRAAITVYLSLVWILLLAFLGSVLESASLQVAKSYRRADIERALECAFAEYQEKLFKEYGIFAVEATYETGSYTESMLKERINYYSGVNSEQTIERIKFLSDGGGEEFFQQASKLMEEKYGLIMEKH